MKEYMDIIKKCPLFIGIEDADIPILLNCLSAKKKYYHKDEIIFHVGDKPSSLGIILSGSVHLVREDYWGNRTILAPIEAGNPFCEAFSCAGAETFPISAIAHEDSTILLIDYQKITISCAPVCALHIQLIQNMLTILSRKNLMMTHKIEHLTQKTTKEKVLSYLSEQALLADGNEFLIPFNRQELAEYLSVERSVLSNTLGKLRNEGIIVFHKNRFKVTNTLY